MQRTSFFRAAAAALIATLFLTGLTLLWTVSANRAFQVDEVEHVHATYNVRTGKLLYADFRQAHNPLLYLVLAPAVDPGAPEASFLRARAVTTALFMVTAALCAVAARRLGTPLAAVLAGGLALGHTTLIERGMEVRPDGPMALCVIAALAVELSGWPRRRRYAAEALLLAAAFLLTNKAAFACFAFGCLWLADAVRRRRPALVAVPMAVWLAPLAAAFGAMALLGNLDEFLAINFGDAVSVATRTAEHVRPFSPGRAGVFLGREAARNVVFSLLAVAGWLAGARRWRTRPGLGFTAFLGAVLFASLWLNPFPYPYLHVTALPVFAVLAAVAAARLVGRLAGPARWAAAFAVLAAAALPGVPYLIARTADADLERQLAVLREVDRVTEPGDAVFDMAGLYFRPDGSPVYLMTGNTLARYELGKLPRIPVELARSGTVAMIYNYRIAWLEGEERAFIEEHFVHYDGNLFLLGSPLFLEPGETMTFEVLKTKPFRYDGRGAILVDGRPFRRGLLERGPHRITRLARRGRDRLVMDTPPPVPWPPRPPAQLYDVFR